MIVGAIKGQGICFLLREGLDVGVVLGWQDRKGVDVFTLSIGFEFFRSTSRSQMDFFFHLLEGTVKIIGVGSGPAGSIWIQIEGSEEVRHLEFQR